MAQYLHGIHDTGHEMLVPDLPGYIVISEAIGHDANDMTGRDYSLWADKGYTVMVRLNNAHNGRDGTLPKAQGDNYATFAVRCGNFVAASRGCDLWIIGNEPNHAQEWPENQMITAAQYAACFRGCADEIAARVPQAQVLVAAVAPWNVQAGDWIAYFRDMLVAIPACDGITLHTYTHGSSPALITAETKMQPPYQDRMYEFRAYRDFLAAVPAHLREVPVYITETDQNEPWLDSNTGWVQAAYAEIDAWNKGSGQKIYALVLYRWSRADQWHIEGKEGVIYDYITAAHKRYPVPATHKVFIPMISNVPTSTPPPDPAVQWDSRLDQRGVVLTPYAPKPGETYYKVVEGIYYNTEEAQGRHHIYADVVTEAGQRVVGQDVRFAWQTGFSIKRTEAKPGEKAAVDMDMYAAGHGYSVRIDGVASDLVSGMGLGDIDSEWRGDHVAYFFKFQAVRAPTATQPAPSPQLKPELSEGHTSVPAPTGSVLLAPVQGQVSQRWGENPDTYQTMLGIPYHNGLDIAAPLGASIIAPADGKVQYVDTDKDYGLYVRIYHPHLGLHTLMAHLSEAAVTAGQVVRQGQIIGKVGLTGFSTGPHVHFEVRIGTETEYYTGTYGHDKGRIDPETAMYLLGQIKPVARQSLVQLVADTAREFGADPAILVALVEAESGYNPTAVSPAGAKGLAQIMPATWAEWAPKVSATDIFYPRDNVRVAAAYFAWLRQQLGNDWSALAAYNFGIGNVLNQVKPPEETVTYANRIDFAARLLRNRGLL